jgi:hypothetical protein
MGAWGVGTFDNDTACDWASDLECTEDLSLVRQSISSVLAVGSAYLDADVACQALAACEVIARMKGNWGPRDAYTEQVDSWVESHHVALPPGLIEVAVSAIDRVLDQPSELLELWDESGDREDWLDSIRDLRNRVRT